MQKTFLREAMFFQVVDFVVTLNKQGMGIFLQRIFLDFKVWICYDFYDALRRKSGILNDLDQWVCRFGWKFIGGEQMESKTGTKGRAERNEKEVSPLLDGVRKVLLAGLGAAALAQDELEDFVKKLVERGEIAEKDAKKLIQETRDKRRKRMGTSEDQINKRMEELLERFNVPTKRDIKTLSDKINALSRKVEELKKTQD